VQVNLLADTDLRTVEEFEQLIVTERDGAVVRIADVAKVELGAEEADHAGEVQRSPERLSRRLAAGRRQRDQRRPKTSLAQMETMRPRRCRPTST
jgi:Cu/Ag efflux pump CusA